VIALQIAVGIAIVAIGATVQATIGFGAGLCAVPLLLVLIPRFVPGPALVGGLLLNVLMVVGHRRHLDRRGLVWIVAGLLPGAALAGVALRLIPSEDLAVLSGGAILVAVGISVAGGVPPKLRSTLLGAGVVAGFMGSTAAISGPPLALVYQREEGPTIRGTLPPAFVVSSLLALATLSAAGKMPAADWLSGVALAPGGWIGYRLGARLHGRVEGPRLRAAVLFVSAASAVVAIVRALS
jgi:uncharacterized membrane protein YfcA